MPRPIEFELEPALDAAMEAFRHKGFAGTSIKAIERATGLSSGSLYNSFGGKDGLFQTALDHYLTKVVGGRLEQHSNPDAPLQGMCELFLTLLDEPGGGSDGCLLTNSAIEFGDTASPFQAAIQTGLRRQETAFLAALDQARPQSPRNAQTARTLLALYQGVLVLVRSGYPKPLLHEMIVSTFATLEGQD